jgi:putative membrane-bound dehydrogenase-like protein
MITACRQLSVLCLLFVITISAVAAEHFVPASSLVAAEGLEVTVWATTPMLHNPTNMDVDHLGRMWVAQGKNYRTFRNADLYGVDSKGDEIVVLTDTDNDGKADKRHVFVQDPDLVAPLGIAVIDNKIVVAQPPSMVIYHDVDRNAVFDPKVDKKEAFLTGFGGRDHDHSLHSVKTGPNGQWYFNVGNAGTHIVTDKDGWTLRVGSSYNGGSPSVTDPGPNQGGRPGLKSDDGHVYVGSVVLRVNPDGTGLRVIGHNMRNSYEETVNSFGDVYQNDNDDPPACRTTWLMEYGNLGYASDDGTRKWSAERRPGQPAAIAEWRQEDPGTIPAGDVYGTGSPTGIAFYENGALGSKYRELLLSCEALRNVVYGYHPKQTGAGFELKRYDFLRSKHENEFGPDEKHLAEAATWFRPSDVVVGADGAIYVADWYDPRVGGHRMSDPKAAGTIYRVAPKGKNPKPAAFDLATVDGQIAALCSPANNVRNLGFVKLKAQGDTVTPAVAELLKSNSHYFRARAIWLLAQLGPNGIKEVENQLKTAKPPQLRITAFRALRFVDHKMLEHAAVLAKDRSPAVRREVALALRDVPLAKCRDIIVELAKGYDGEDRWYLEALGTACTGKEAEIYALLVKALKAGPAERWDARFANIAWRLHPPASVDAFKQRALSKRVTAVDRKAALTAIAYIPTEEAAMAMIEVAENGPDDARSLASFWLYNRSRHVWEPYADRMKGLNKKPNQLKADKDYKAPVDGPEISKLPSVQDVLALNGDPGRGKAAVARCYMCHQVDGTGVDFGPALAGWGKGNSREVIAKAIMKPNDDIAHGFEATRIVTKQGHTIEGFVMFAGGSYIVKVMGGGEVTLPRKHIKSIEQMDTSLMISAAQLGLSAQDVADVVAYLKEGDPETEARESSRTESTTAAAAKAQLANSAKKNKQILFIAGDTKHRHGFHEYKAGSMLLADALNKSGLPVEAKVHWYGWPEDESIFDGVDACIVYADGGGNFGEKYAFLDKKVKAGMGLMFMHYGVHPTKEVGEKYYKNWTGGYYDDAFSVNPSWIADLAPKAGHPVSHGIDRPVRAFDEFYWNLNLSDDCQECYPLATATPTRQNMVRYGSSKFWNKDAADKLGTKQVLMWCRDAKSQGRGAGFVGGHYHRNWAIDDYRKLVLNTIAWVARLDVPANGVPSKPVTKAMLNQNLNRPDYPEEVELPTPDLLLQPAGKFPVLGPDGRMPPRKRPVRKAK